MDAITFLRPDGLVASPAFSHAVVIPPGATTVLVGGQNAVDADGALVGGDDVAVQVRTALRNAETALAAAGCGLADVVSWTVLLRHDVDVRAAYAVVAEILPRTEHPPLVTAALVTALGVPGALVELSATAAVVR